MFKKLLFTLIIGVLGTNCFLKAQVNPPELRCIAVEDNGDITITWIPPLDPLGQFIEYQIYRSLTGGPYSIVGSGLNNRLRNVYTDLAVNFPNTDSVAKYFIRVSYNDGSGKVSAPSDTLSAMLLTLKISGNTAGDLNWTKMRPVPLPTWEKNYNLNRKLTEIGQSPNSKPWINLGILDYSVISFKDSVTRCKRDIYYQLDLKDNSGCVSKSNLVKEKLEDNLGPTPMGYDRISVNKNGSTRLFWSKHKDPTVVNYLLVYNDPGGPNVLFDTISSSTFEWEDREISRTANARSQCYQIVPFDSCGKSQGATKIHCTMFLSYTFDQCAGEVTLNWTPYVGWGQGIKEYNIYRALNKDTNYVKIGTVNETDTFFVVKNIKALSTYNFYIEAVDGTGLLISNSNIIETKFNAAGKVEFLHLRSASVISENEVSLKVLMDRKAPFNYINIYRAVQRRGPFKKIGAQRPFSTNVNDTLFNLIDTLGKPYQINYVYYLEVVDTCNQPVRISNKFRTLFLSGVSDKYSLQNDLKWAASISYDSSAIDKDVYSLYRSINRSYAPDPIRSLWSNTLDYLDDISNDIHKGDEFCYRLQLAQTASDTFALPDTSLSNEVCFKIEPDIFIPNSFTPNKDGNNETWRPKTSFIIPMENYLLRIYDRWGKLAFESTNPLEGWDGTRNSGAASEGMYVYTLNVITVYGSKIERKGNFYLVR